MRPLSHSLSRRDFIGRIGTGLALAGAGSVLPALHATESEKRRERVAREAQDRGPRALVFIHLAGGLDPHEVLVPYADERYRRARPTLALQRDDCLPLGGGVALSRACASWEPALREGRAIMLPNVRSGVAELSHFRASELLRSASPAGEIWSSGWLGHAAEKCAARRAVRCGCSSPAEMRAFARDASQSLSNPVKSGAVAAGLVGECGQAWDKTLAQIAEQVADPSGDEFYFVSVDGFDTHFGQAAARDRVLRPFAEALAQFQSQLECRGVSGRVLTVVTSEFGRTLEENDQGGTDHAPGGLLMLLGEGLQPQPFASGLSAAPLDLRSVYASVLRDWLEVAPANVLRDAVPPLELFSSPDSA